ncbi:CLUMA_CG007560, isoform A [Clunio marinus]|uniref:CLUMA_CG007560, isoform A n=1 Tax=Clunio marinus TaxID=568069 RepID=A0A1J1I364_9DIPT|nr:CLUMA_CG007560, isoform A [Clunio marinus]
MTSHDVEGKQTQSYQFAVRTANRIISRSTAVITDQCIVTTNKLEYPMQIPSDCIPNMAHVKNVQSRHSKKEENRREFEIEHRVILIQFAVKHELKFDDNQNQFFITLFTSLKLIKSHQIMLRRK